MKICSVLSALKHFMYKYFEQVASVDVFACGTGPIIREDTVINKPELPVKQRRGQLSLCPSWSGSHLNDLNDKQNMSFNSFPHSRSPVLSDGLNTPDAGVVEMSKVYQELSRRR